MIWSGWRPYSWGCSMRQCLYLEDKRSGISAMVRHPQNHLRRLKMKRRRSETTTMHIKAP